MGSRVGDLLDCLTHRVHILEMNGESFRLADSKRRKRSRPGRPVPPEDKDPEDS
jgi:hypothetical protein